MHKEEIPAHIFRAYDIRGIFNDDLYPETMLKIGRALGTYAKGRGEKSVVVGNDIRATSTLLANAFISGLLSSDLDVTNTCTTSRDSTRLEKAMGNLQKVLATIYSKISDDERGEVWDLLKQANEEECVVDKINLINIVMGIIVGKISSQLGKVNESKSIIVEQHGPQSGVYIESENKAVNISGDLRIGLENLKLLIEDDYDKKDKSELLQTINHMKKSCDDSSKKNLLKEKLGWILTKTSEFSSISSLVIALLNDL